MCQISNQLKLCTCDIPEEEREGNYWVLYRHSDIRNSLLGFFDEPANIGQQAHIRNKRTIRTLLNRGNCFDKEMNLAEGDVLELNFDCKNPGPTQSENFEWHGNYLTYKYLYTNGKWRQARYEPWDTETDEKCAGVIENAMVVDVVE